jgi:hypothetical protein
MNKNSDTMLYAENCTRESITKYSEKEPGGIGTGSRQTRHEMETDQSSINTKRQ